MMKCPVCHRNMSELFISGTLVDYCTNCRGTWYDKNELSFLVMKPKELLKFLKAGLLNRKPSQRLCPKCNQNVVTRNGFFVRDVNIINGRCSNCSHEIAGQWGQ